MNYTHDDELSLKLFVVLSKAFGSISDKVKKDIRSHGLNPTEFAVLELLYHKGDQPIQKIGQKILLASGSITYVVDKLEEKDLLQRKPCPNDRRITHASISEKGKDWMDEHFPLHQKRIQEIMEGLTTEEKQAAIELIKKLGQNATKE